MTGGLQPFGLRQSLEPGARLDQPRAVYGYVADGLNAAVQRLHDWQRRQRPDPDRPIPVQFNSWYPYQGEPDALHVRQLIDPPEHDYGHGETYPMPGDLAFRTRVAMLGTFGLSAATQEWSPEDFDLAAQHVALYRQRIRPLLHHGDQYRLTEQPPFDGAGDWAAMWYAAKDGREGVLFAFRLARGDAEKSFSLPGLAVDLPYEVRIVGGEADTVRGADLAHGLAVTCPAPFTSQVVLVQAQG